MGEILAAVEAAIDEADHLKPLDGAAKALARNLAVVIDAGDSRAVPAFLRLLNALGLTPQGRKELMVDDPAPVGALSGIRAKRVNRAGVKDGN